MSYYSYCKVNLEDFSCYSKDKTTEQNINLIKGERDEVQRNLDYIWLRVSIICSMSHKNLEDVVVLSEDIIKALRSLYEHKEKLEVVLDLLQGAGDPEDEEHQKVFWVNHYEEASAIHCKDAIAARVKDYENYITQDYQRLAVFMAMDPQESKEGDDDIAGTIVNKLQSYRESLEDLYNSRTQHLLFLKYPSKNEDEENWGS